MTAFKRVERRSVPDEVFQQLVDGVVGGELGAGASLPAERQLAEVLGVSRPAVREALQRLAQTGLVEVRQGGGTTVRDYRSHAGLDLLPRLLIRGGQLDTAVVRSIMEARLAVGQEVAALAATRAGARLESVLGEAISALSVTEDPVEQQRHALEFWSHVVDGADSIVFRLMFNNLRAAYEPALDALSTVLGAEVGRVGHYRSVAAAIVAGEAAGAKQRAAELLQLATDEMDGVLRALEASAEA
ncbi:FadR/GntR family transcriptional regulator [Amycolatopsis sp. 195334CR]|uniref:FadR/GntR family transcriptional regulator n=1 Tax=Amycolatopsis sp. 195334CR TaxID=2814588 RepID=UPI001A8F22B8|nr:GntR family transcriptional regulator [Amycolatopsis sp. 195334CR]MBN6039483.1 FadR family transcriptional regulator [Amycolatopsis sp. 195334CR]